MALSSEALSLIADDGHEEGVLLQGMMTTGPDDGHDARLQLQHYGSRRHDDDPQNVGYCKPPMNNKSTSARRSCKINQANSSQDPPALKALTILLLWYALTDQVLSPGFELPTQSLDWRLAKVSRLLRHAVVVWWKARKLCRFSNSQD